MNNFTFENQGTSTYLVYEIQNCDSIDSLSMGMLTNNKIPGLAGTIFTQIDSARYIKYNISSKVSLKELFSRPVNKKRLLGAFKGIIEAMASAEDYMIELSSILLDLDYIFTDVSSCETVLICLPVMSDKQNIDLGMFFKNIMFSTQFDQTENCDHVAKIINYLNSTSTVSLDVFGNLLDSLDEQVKAEAKKQASPPPQKVQPSVAGSGQVSVLSYPSVPRQSIPAVPASQPVPQPVSQPEIQPKAVEAPQEQEDNSDVKMTFMYLMRHYSKENAELYKQKKDVAKTSGPEHSKPKEKKRGKDKDIKTVQPDFQVPGIPTQYDFQVPTSPIENSPAPAQPQKAPAKPQQPVVQPQLPKQPTVQQAPTTGGSANYGNTTVLNAGMRKGETTVLNAASTPVQTAAYLIRMKNHEKIILNKPVFRIGKERSYVDYFVVDNPAISRSHANIVSRDGAYYVVDTNSTNHTFVDGEMIQSNLEVKLNHGSKLRLANEEFELRLY